jgi:hypothetical protein
LKITARRGDQIFGRDEYILKGSWSRYESPKRHSSSRLNL